MAIITKTSAASWLTGWSPSGPSATNDARVTSAGGSGSYSVASGDAPVVFSSVAILSDAPTSVSILVGGAAGVSTQVTARGGDRISGYSVYVADNKIFSPGAVEFNASSVSTHFVYVGANSEIQGGMRSTVANTNEVIKEGPGLWVSGFGTGNFVSALGITGGIVRSTSTGGNFAVSGAITINNNATFSIQGTRTYANPIAIGNAGGQIEVGGGITGTFSGAFSGAGTLAKTGSGTLSITTSSLSMPLNISAGAVTMAAGLSVTSGVSGSGTLNLPGTRAALNQNTLNGNVTATTINGDYKRIVAVAVSDSGNSTGYPEILDANGAGTLTISGTWTGNLDTIYSSPANKKTVIVTGKLQGTLFPNAALRLGTQATLTQSGAAAQINGPVSLGFDAAFNVAAGATANATLTTVTGGGYNDHYLTADSNASNSYSGNIASGSTTGTMYVDVASGGTLSLTGANQTWSTGATARKFIKRQAGTLKVTGKLTVNTAPFDVLAGKLEINSTSQAAFNAGLSMGASTTLACASSGAYAAQIAGAVTLAAGATMKFGSA